MPHFLLLLIVFICIYRHQTWCDNPLKKIAYFYWHPWYVFADATLWTSLKIKDAENVVNKVQRRMVLTLLKLRKEIGYAPSKLPLILFSLPCDRLLHFINVTFSLAFNWVFICIYKHQTWCDNPFKKIAYFYWHRWYVFADATLWTSLKIKGAENVVNKVQRRMVMTLLKLRKEIGYAPSKLPLILFSLPCDRSFSVFLLFFAFLIVSEEMNKCLNHDWFYYHSH